MRQTIRLGRVAGIPVGANWSVLVITALLAYGLYASVLPTAAPGSSAVFYAVVALAAALIFLACLFAHELAHALVARHFDIGTARITLWLLGGVSELEREAPTPRAELLVAGAGPLTSLIVGAVGGGAAALLDAAGASHLVVVAVLWLSGVNLILGVFNLLPGAPLDGGRVLRAILWRTRGDKAAAQMSADRAGIVLGTVLALAGGVELLFAGQVGGLWLVLLGWFLVAAARAETNDVLVHSALDGLTVRDVMISDIANGYDVQTVDTFVREVAQRHRHRAYPVLDIDGRLSGMVSLRQLTHVPAAERSTRRLAAVATPITRIRAVAVDEPLPVALTALTPWTPMVPVLADGRLVGILSRDDVDRAIELFALNGGHTADVTRQ